MSYCPKCKTQNGPHFIPPSVGEPGFFSCDSAEETEEVFRKHHEMVLENYDPRSRVGRLHRMMK